MHIGPLTIPVPALLAPMAAVTDLPFRTVCEEHGAGLTFTEFVSAHALSYGSAKAAAMLAPSLGGRPYGAQIFGREPEVMARAAEVAVGAGASLLDINMGCPAKKVIAGECGSALMKEPELAAAIVRAVRRAVPADVPVTVKHRAGWDEQHRNAPDFACALVEAGAAMITVHGRTRAQSFSGRSDLEIIRRVREAVPASVPVVGNGDVVDVESYRRMRGETGCDAVMIGRGALGNPFLFRSIRALEAGLADPGAPTLAERAAVLERHVGLMLELAPRGRLHHEVRKAAAWYTRGLHGSNALRQRAWTLDDPREILRLTRDFIASRASRRHAAA